MGGPLLDEPGGEEAESLTKKMDFWINRLLRLVHRMMLTANSCARETTASSTLTSVSRHEHDHETERESIHSGIQPA